MGWGRRGEKALCGKPTSCGQSSGEGIPTKLEYQNQNNQLLQFDLRLNTVLLNKKTIIVLTQKSCLTGQHQSSHGKEGWIKKKGKILQLIACFILQL